MTAEGQPAKHDDELALLTFDGISKRYPGTQALKDVSLSIKSGEIHALAGQNGAGKSTLIKILAGVEVPDEGSIYFRGEPVRPHHANLPINFIHQDMGLIASMTVAENFALSIGYPRRHGLIGWKDLRKRTRSALAAVGANIDPEQTVVGLSTGQRSLVAIARAIATEADLIVLDEPTAALTVKDVAILFTALRKLRDDNVAMLYVTHRLDEVFTLADTVTVLRDGLKIFTSPVSHVTLPGLIESIVGRPIESFFPTIPKPSDAAILEVDGLTIGNCGPVSFRVFEGEITALVGLRGAGQDSVGRAIFGAARADSGTVRMRGLETKAIIRDSIGHGIGFVSGRRVAEGLGAFLTVRENLLYNPDWVRAGRRRWRAADRRVSKSLVNQFGIVPRDVERLVLTLSGGNQQKVLVARWMQAESRLLILEEPTAGVDVGAKEELYASIADLCAAGRACLLVSSDFDEVAGLAHRALVFDRGRIVSELEGDRLTSQAISQQASGGTSSSD